MSKTNIDWPGLTDVFNYISGCLHNCPGCYAERFCHRFPKVWPKGFAPDIHPDRLNDPRLWNKKKHFTFFVCSMGDMFGEWVPAKWIETTLQACRDNPQHTYMFLTKNPKRYQVIDFLGIDTWIGTSIDGRNQAVDEKRLYDLNKVRIIGKSRFRKFLSIEPLSGPITSLIDMIEYDLAIVGTMTGRKKVPPAAEWLDSLKIIPPEKLYFKENIRGFIK